MDALSIICICIVTATFMWLIIDDIIKERKKPPYGVKAVEQFLRSVSEIGQISNTKDHVITCTYNNKSFDVRVEKEKPYIGLEYETIPMYNNQAVYINDELVARVHIIHESYNKDRKFIEHSSKRPRLEVWNIVVEAGKIAKTDNDKKLKAVLGIKESFFDQPLDFTSTK